jgi:DNA-binding NarL/FixJ family response regulator
LIAEVEFEVAGLLHSAVEEFAHSGLHVGLG